MSPVVAIAVGVTLGMGVAGAFTLLAVSLFQRIKREESGPESAVRMLKVFVGLMVARMVGYLALLMITAALKVGDTVGVALGLAGGTVIFQGLEIHYLRKKT